MRTYTSCNCRYCRRLCPSHIKRKFHKDPAHRKLRRITKRALHNRERNDGEVEIPPSVSTGYKT